MKRCFVALVLCFCSFTVYAQKTRYGQESTYAKAGVDYPIQMHVFGIHYRPEYTGSSLAGYVIYADAFMNGRKIELVGDRDEFPFRSYKVSLGDYQARLLKDPMSMNAPIAQVYELVLPDKVVWRCTVTGFYE